MAEAYRNEADLSDFLMTTRVGDAAAGDRLERAVARPDGSLVGATVDGSWRMVDSCDVNPTATILNGCVVVYQDDTPVWAATSHTMIPAAAWREPILAFYRDMVVASPDPGFPVSGVPGIHDERFRLVRASLLPGELTIARFAIVETILDQEVKNYYPHDFRNSISGGWIR